MEEEAWKDFGFGYIKNGTSSVSVDANEEKIYVVETITVTELLGLDSLPSADIKPKENP